MRSPFLNGDDKLPGGMMNKNSAQYQATLNKTTQKNNNKNVVDPPKNLNFDPSVIRKGPKPKETEVMPLNFKPAQKMHTGAATTGLANLAITPGGQDILNWAPGAGEIIDAKNTVKDFSKGDYVGAAANAAGFMIPFLPGGVVKKGLKKLEDVFYPNTVYRSQPVSGNRVNYKLANTPEAVKVNKKGDFYTSDWESAEYYARGDLKGLKGIKQGDDVVMSQAKLPFWMKPTTKDKDVINLKKLYNSLPDPSEYIVPSKGFSSMFVKKKEFAIKGMPEHIRNTKEAKMYIGHRPFDKDNFYYSTQGGKYVLDQFEGAKSYFNK